MATSGSKRTLDARPDTPDFRDRMYIPTLVEVPPSSSLAEYRTRYPDSVAPILDQGTEGACVGFATAAAVHFLLRTRSTQPNATPVSPRMLYEMARRYDDWRGEDYEGSSIRAAMKGWHKHGVCARELWPHKIKKSENRLTHIRSEDARARPLGAYFRVNHKDIVAMHAALAEVGILVASANVHDGWSRVTRSGAIPSARAFLGGHAFAIVAYDQDGFWIQNSWGASWGKGGFGHLSYDDWLENGRDAWVARLGVPTNIGTGRGIAAANVGSRSRATVESIADLAPHIVMIGNDGAPYDRGPYATTPQTIRALFDKDLPRITKDWRKPRILLYAHGGLVADKEAAQRVAEYRAALLGKEVYPIAFIWRSDLWTTIGNILSDALARRRDEGLWDKAKDFMLDRLDDALEPVARFIGGKALWDEMKENALFATTRAHGGARVLCDRLTHYLENHPEVEVHVAGHSAGSIFMAPIVQYLCTRGTIRSGPMQRRKGKGLTLGTCTLWAPAITLELFKESYLPAIGKDQVRDFSVFTLTRQAEQDDHCKRIYNKSLLYLVSNALEEHARVPLFRDGEPLLGLEESIRDDKEIARLLTGPSAKGAWVLSPNTAALGSPRASRAISHGDFDNDQHTVEATLARILGKPNPIKGRKLELGALAKVVERRSDLERQMSPRLRS